MIDEPVISLDITASILAAASAPIDPPLDGENLIPYLRGEASYTKDRSLYWRFWNQAAVRSGDWKLIRASDEHELLFNLAKDPQESTNEVENFPEIAKKLRTQLEAWAEELEPAGLPTKPLNGQEREWYRFYFPADPRTESSEKELIQN